MPWTGCSPVSWRAWSSRVSERVVLVVNPHATRVRPAVRRRVTRALAEAGLVDEVETTIDHRAGELATEAARAGATIVAVLGGDGSVNEAAGALAGGPTALLPLAGGSTNVFTRAVGWAHPVDAALASVVETLRAPTVRTVRLGRLQAEGVDRVFCVNAGVGVDANTVARVEQSTWLKQRLRQAGFGLIAIAEAARAARRPACLAFTVDDSTPTMLATVVVATGSPYAYVGRRPLVLTPGAQFDGRLRWLGLPRTGPRQLASVVTGGLRAGRHLGHDGVLDGWAERAIEIEADHPVAVQADGEPLGAHRSIRITPGPELRVLVPREH